MCIRADEIFPRIPAAQITLTLALNMLRPACVLVQTRSGCKFYVPAPETAAIISLCCLQPFVWKKPDHA